MDLDILFYAVIAGIVLVRLWSVLGRRNDDEPQRPNPFVMPAPGKTEDKTAIPASSAIDNGVNRLQLPKPPSSAPASLAGGLEQIRALDPSFDEKNFLQGARSAFSMIVEDFAKGDMSRIGRLLGPRVLPHFQNAIEARRQAGQTMESRIEKIRDAEAVAARVEDSRAIVTVRFVTEQQNTLRDAQNHAVAGHEGQLEEITDLWTFERDTKSADPNWILTETRS